VSVHALRLRSADWVFDFWDLIYGLLPYLCVSSLFRCTYVFFRVIQKHIVYVCFSIVGFLTYIPGAPLITTPRGSSKSTGVHQGWILSLFEPQSTPKCPKAPNTQCSTFVLKNKHSPKTSPSPPLIVKKPKLLYNIHHRKSSLFFIFRSDYVA